MTNPREQANFEQLAASIRDTWGPCLWGFYTGCVRAGFGERSAMELTCTYLEAMILKESPPSMGNEPIIEPDDLE